VLTNLTTEGFPGDRYHPGCEFADEIEKYAIDQARSLFRSKYANVQPHSGTNANSAVLHRLLNRGDAILGMSLNAGGHLSHGASSSFSGRNYKSIKYGTVNELLDYEVIREIALRFRPKLIICGSSSYPRYIDFARFREIADEVGAILVADISHISGLVAAGLHPSPLPHAHVVTTSTYKQLYGPRGGLLLSSSSEIPGHDEPIVKLLNSSVFPLTQGTPDLSSIAAKAAAFSEAATPAFGLMMRKVVALAAVMAEEFLTRGYRIVTGGTDNHMVVVDLTEVGLSGRQVERALEDIGILANRNVIPSETRGPKLASGLRLGTNVLAYRGFTDVEIRKVVSIVDGVIQRLMDHCDDRWIEYAEEVKCLAALRPLKSSTQQ
jgi:glycine hydroxymethyltransferase